MSAQSASSNHVVITEAFVQGTEPSRYCSHDGVPPVESPKEGEEF